MTFLKLYNSWSDGQRRSFDLLYSDAKVAANALFGDGAMFGIPTEMTPSPIEAIFAVSTPDKKYKLLFATYDVEKPFYNADDCGIGKSIEEIPDFREGIEVESIDDIIKSKIKPKNTLQEAQHEGS